MITVRQFWLLPGQRPGDVVGATVISGDGTFRVQEWVMTPKGVLMRWLLPPGMVAE